MSRTITWKRLSKRRHYHGFDYRTQRELERSGAEWRELGGKARIEFNGDCIAAYMGAELQLEIYQDGET